MSTAHHHSENSPPTVPSPDVPEQFAQDTGDDNVRATDKSKNNDDRRIERTCSPSETIHRRRQRPRLNNNDRRIERTCSPSETIQGLGDDNAPTDPGDTSCH
ncbi:uncharacterized protein CPUR_08870 [Claviceps purpurea 20.1]|uniref:Uncharacterized protein n=1 Tax=Claviceps purpurea (strain 20.1) TaxID=1111077 RepID=M1W6Y4_CLAP2|nr:uncharacterized protein CPUR_08870 [Claviceps purpurea 20.1]